ncbi:NS2 [Aphis craccivora]|uniref:NS2 n=1 Tax=Aphis craccivora TaxID=307492 RepID=A0A6G0XP16_APHCR|nr:NS2 [Aphis craccivora]
MNNNSDFESGAFLDLECSQQFKPSQTLAIFLESTEQELQSQQTSTPLKTAKVGIKRNLNQVQQNLELRCTKKPKQMNFSKNSKNLSVPTNMETATLTAPDTPEMTKGEQRRVTMLELPMTNMTKWVKMNIVKNLRDSEIFFRINDDHIQFTGGHGRTDLLSIDNNRSNDGYTIPETLHPKKWMPCLPETVTVMTEMETATFQELIPEYSKLLTSLRQEVKTSYSELRISSLITIGSKTFVTSPMLLCHLDAMELFDSLTTFADTSNFTENNLSLSSANTTTTSTSLTPVSRQTKLVGAHGSNAVHISENIDESTFEDAFMRATSEVATGRPLCDIFVQTAKAKAKEMYFPSADERLYNQVRNFSTQQNTVCSKEGLVETCIDECTWDIFGGKSALRRGNAGGRGHIGRRVQTAKSKDGVDIDGSFPVTIEDLFKYYPTCPPDAFINIKEFNLNPILNKYDETDRNIRLQLRNWCNVIRDWDIFDFNTCYHTSGVKPYFNAYSRTSTSVYYSVENSLRIANELLLYQFQNDEILVKHFLNTLYNVLDKKIPKLNSICIYSPPSAGKNFFFDAVASYFLNYGMFGTANKNNNFTWADGVGKRLVIWNEPNYEQAHIEKMKELLGGILLEFTLNTKEISLYKVLLSFY